MGLLERSLEFVQLVGREGRPVATMLLLAPVAVYVLPAACAEFLVAAAAGGVAAVLTWKPQQRERGRVSERVGQVSSETVVTGNRSGNGDRFIRSRRRYYPHYTRIIVAIRSAATRVAMQNCMRTCVKSTCLRMCACVPARAREFGRALKRHSLLDVFCNS